MLPSYNPFSTCYTAPGCVPFLCGEETRTAEPLLVQLHEQWLQNGRCGAIVGPHGAGKSTLLAALQKDWTTQYNYQVTTVALHNGQRTLPAVVWQHELGERDLLIVDGYEQLGWRARWQLNRLRRRTACGLLVTTHAESRLPTLYRVEPCYETLLAVVRRLLAPWEDSSHAEQFIARHVRRAWQENGANARETLFRLYDCWEVETTGLRSCADDSGQRDASDSATLVVSSN